MRPLGSALGHTPSELIRNAAHSTPFEPLTAAFLEMRLPSREVAIGCREDDMRGDFNPALRAFLFAGILGISTESVAQANKPGVPVLIQNDANVPPEIFGNAKREVERLFRLIGIDITWVDTVSAVAGQLRVVSVTRWEPSERKIQPTVLGYAQTAPGQRKVRAYVFWRRVERASQTFTASLDKLLAIAIAHEIGHMLLPTGKHAKTGLMRAPWDANHFRSASAGLLTFSDESATAIRRGVDAEQAALSTSVRARR